MFDNIQGTPVEFWMSDDAEETCSNVSAVPKAGGAYNGMVKPLLNMTIFGKSHLPNAKYQIPNAN